MEGYIVADAVAYIVQKLQKSGEYKSVSKETLTQIVSRAIALEMAYMQKVGEEYDEDDAFESIIDTLVEEIKPDEDEEMQLCAIINDYMAFNDEYMEEKTL